MESLSNKISFETLYIKQGNMELLLCCEWHPLELSSMQTAQQYVMHIGGFLNIPSNSLVPVSYPSHSSSDQFHADFNQPHTSMNWQYPPQPHLSLLPGGVWSSRAGQPWKEPLDIQVPHSEVSGSWCPALWLSLTKGRWKLMGKSPQLAPGRWSWCAFHRASQLPHGNQHPGACSLANSIWLPLLCYFTLLSLFPAPWNHTPR